LEDPGTSEEARPGLDCIVEDLSLGGHEEARVATDLTKLGIAHLGFNDRVDETEGERMFFHLHSVEVIECKFTHTLNADDEFTAKVGLLCLKVDLFVHEGGGENVVADADVVDKN